MNDPILTVFGGLYRSIIRPACFLFESEPIHDAAIVTGALFGKFPGMPQVLRALFRSPSPSLATTVAGLSLETPVGLAAGFDHEARLPRILSGLGFGFGTVGTVTAKPYAGNPYPRLKRLPRSRALLVNKGFKSSGIDAVLDRLSQERFDIPIGLSIGRTNAPDITTHDAAINDIVTAFRAATERETPFSYYELNISCPNLVTKVEFDDPEHFRALLRAVFILPIVKPLFVKMPITLSQTATTALIDVAREFSVTGVVFGNLQKDRTHPSFDPAELEPLLRYPGNWSGSPCRDRSDELVALAYRHTRGTFPIIGCGGIFSAEDAYRKICLGASALQIATALVFEGPVVAAEISAGLARLLKSHGYRNVADAVGAAHHTK